jgi:hypothetical protein
VGVGHVYWCFITAFDWVRLVVSGSVLGDDSRLIAIIWGVFAVFCSVFVHIT